MTPTYVRALEVGRDVHFLQRDELCLKRDLAAHERAKLSLDGFVDSVETVLHGKVAS